MRLIGRFIRPRIHLRANGPADRPRLILVSFLSLMLVTCGCGLIGITKSQWPEVEPCPPAAPLSPIQLAIRYLEFSQTKQDWRRGNLTEYAGHWPESNSFRPEGPLVPELSSFSTALVHHSLCLVNENTQAALGVTDAEVAAARQMRMQAIELMRRYESPPGTADAGTFGYWPDRRLLNNQRCGDCLLSPIVKLVYCGPSLHGYRAPPAVSFFPSSFEIPSDADTTAAVYSALLDHARLDGGEPLPAWVAKLFADWRDLGQVPQRNDRFWLPERSGAFLTWLAYRDNPERPNLNDVDVIVNVNILCTLGRLGRLDTPGACKAIQLVNNTIASGVHRTNPNELSLYYSDTLILHYFVTRAFREGGVTDLAPSVEILVDDLLASVQADGHGRYFWDRGSPSMNTAFGALALMNADVAPEIVAGAIDYLKSRQNPHTGAWEAGLIMMAELSNGACIFWRSKPVTTAWALEALCRHRLKVAGADLER